MKQTKFLICTSFAAICWLLSGTAQAATFIVTNTNDAGAGSLRQAITEANDAASDDVIMFDASVFNTSQVIFLTSGELQIFNKGNLTIAGRGTNLLTVSGNNQSRVLRIAGGTVRLTDLVITGGRSTFAAGILIEDANAIVTLERVTVENNSAIGSNGVGSIGNGSPGSAGAILVNGTLNLNNSTVFNNMAQGGAGTVGGSFTGNPGGNGGNADTGGIYVNGFLNVINSIVRANKAQGGDGGNGGSYAGSSGGSGGKGGNGGSASAGGIYVNSSALVNIKNSLLSENKALAGISGIGGTGASSNGSVRGGNGGNGGAGGGGGIYINNLAAVVNITNSLLVGNQAQAGLGGNGGSSSPGTPGIGGAGANGEGGGIRNKGTLAVTNSTIDGNVAVGSSHGIGFANTCGQGFGGGIYQTGASNLINATVTRNSVTGLYSACAGIELKGGGIYSSSTFGNTIIAANVAIPSNPNFTLPSDLSGSFNSLGYNLITNTTDATFTGTTTGNITGVDPLLGALANNGGATFTRAPAANSPIINAGSNSLAVDAAGNPLRFDQRGGCFRRIVGTAVDIGAFEVQATANPSCNTAFDFDGDYKSDISVFRPSNGTWYTLRSSDNGFRATQFGISTDKPAPADYDGDGIIDIAVFRPSNGTWYLLRSSLGLTAVQFGQSGDIPVPADYDGDGRSEIAVYRNGIWFTLNLVNSQFQVVQFGLATDKPVVGDFDGDGKADFAVFRPSDGTWYLLQSTGGFSATRFGDSADRPVPADYDGDGRTDIAVFRPSNGVWYLLGSSAGFTATQFGISTDTPVPADFDGDGRSDIAVYRGGTWYLLRSTAGFTAVQFGSPTDNPIPVAYVP